MISYIGISNDSMPEYVGASNFNVPFIKDTSMVPLRIINFVEKKSAEAINQITTTKNEKNKTSLKYSNKVDILTEIIANKMSTKPIVKLRFLHPT